MTAEVAILNQHGIALASDSAVTIGEQRVWTNTNKIFSLGPRNDIAIMIYGSGDFAGFAWELLIKQFKRDNAKKSFSTVEECKRAFRAFLEDDRWYNSVQSHLCPYSIFLKEMKDLFDVADETSSTAFRRTVKEALSEWMELATQCERCITGLTFADFKARFSSDIENFRSETFSRHFPKYLSDLLEKYLFEYFTRARCGTGYESGVVICGYGAEELYPSLVEIIVDGRHEEFVRSWDGRSANLNDDPIRSAHIIPFAQRDMANLFMEGLSSSYITYFRKVIGTILTRKTEDALSTFKGSTEEKMVERRIQQRADSEIARLVSEDLHEMRELKFVQPLMANVQALPREEMAAMAESLVELTSLRRKFDSLLQSVGGPVDVAFVSKADGFIWMKRKHYFDRNINMEFSARKNYLESPS